MNQVRGGLDSENYYRILGGPDNVNLDKADILNLILYMSTVDLAMLRTLRVLAEFSRGEDVSGTLVELNEAVAAISERQTNFMGRLAGKVSVNE